MPSQGPGGSPRNFTSTGSTSTSITLSWDRVLCEDRNGNITGYSIQYGITFFETSTGTSPSNRTFTASGLVPLTTYMFRIAAVNSHGEGPYRNGKFSTAFPEGAIEL